MASFFPQEASTSTSDHESELREYFINNFMPPDARSIPGNEWMTQASSDMPNTLLYANGRFQGLVPGLSPEDGYGGHPGLIYKLIVCALCFGINTIGISISKTIDNKKSPLTYEQKLPLIYAIIRKLETDVIDNILESFVQNDEVRTILERRFAALNIHVEPLTNPFSMVLAFKNFFNLPDGSKLIMATGLETKSDGTEYNKYAKTFDKLVGTGKPFESIGFILTSRKEIESDLRKPDTMSGTYIRRLILEKKYEEFAGYLFDAGFTTDELISLYGVLISNMKKGMGVEASQDAQGYTDILQQSIESKKAEFDFLKMQIASQEEQEKTDSEDAINEYENTNPGQFKKLRSTLGGLSSKKNKRKSRRTKKRRKSKQSNRRKSRRS
jgi:hypothetical protein